MKLENMNSNQYNQGLIWKKLTINDEVYMISTMQKDDMIKVLLTNFIEIWMESLTDETILDKCQKLNPLLNIEALNYKDVVLNILNNIPTHIVDASPEQIKVRANVEGGLMKFALNLTKGTPQQFWEFVTKPLCISAMEAIRQHKFLLDLIQRKDEEIAEYKAEGAELIRKYIETEPFKQEQLKTNISVINAIDYTNIFQTITNFYNALNLSECNKVSAKSISSSEGNNMEQSMDISKQDNTNSFKEVTNGGFSTPVQSEALPLLNKKQKKGVQVEATVKARTANMAYRPVKKIKKDVTDSIL